MPKTKKIPPGGRVVTRAELTFFANACEAMMNAKIQQLREEPTTKPEPVGCACNGVHDGPCPSALIGEG